MYGGSWELVSRRDVKTLRREVLSAKPGVPKAAPHHRWRNTTVSFGPSDCPENMAGAGVLPLVTAPVIANIRLYHVLIDGGAGLNVISYAAFKLERCIADDVEAGPTVNQHVIEPHVGYDRSGD